LLNNYRFLPKRFIGRAGCICPISLIKILMQAHRYLLPAFCTAGFIMPAANCHLAGSLNLFNLLNEERLSTPYFCRPWLNNELEKKGDDLC